MTEHVDAPRRREVLGYERVRAAARDYETYSSDLLGDRDVRTYRQLPLELDPPRHTLMREALQPLFMGAAIEKHTAEFEALASQLIRNVTERGGGEVAADVALPYVIGCLAIIYNRPQDYEEWLSWGPDVWTAEAYANGEVTAESMLAQRERRFDGQSQRSGAVLDRYLTRVFDAAEANPVADPADWDVWDHVSQLLVAGEPISRQEMHGIANVLLAGGRDTVIKLTTGLIWHLVGNPVDREFIAENPDSFNRVIAELVRYLSPLAKMERALPNQRDLPLAERDPDQYVLLNFASANYDRAVWPDADVVDIHRDRRPHLAFGFGRHSCMGMNITEQESKAFLRVLVDHWPGWVFDGEPQIEWAVEGEGPDTFTIIDRFVSVPVRVG